MCSRRDPSPYHVDTWNKSREDIQQWHQEYQYQKNSVDSDNISKFLMWPKGVAHPNGLWMDDLYGSLGAFSFYAALGGFFYHRIAHTRTRLTVTEVYIYMRDVFTFHDRTEKKPIIIQNGTQYFCHWNKTGFIIVLASTVIGEVTTADWLNYTVARAGVVSKNTVYYPIRNRDYRDLQLRHKQGGDLVLYSNLYRVPLYPPKVLEFDQ